MLPWLSLALVGCSGREPEPPPSPTVALVLPAGALAEEMASAARVALEPEYGVRLVDEAAPRAIAELQADAVVVVALAHLSTASVDRAASSWTGGDLPVITLASGSKDTLPRLVPSPLEQARCAAGLAQGDQVVLVHDGGASGMANAEAARVALEGRVDEVLGLAPDTLSADAGRVAQRGPSGVIYTGGLGQGGDLLRLLLPQGYTGPFLAVGDDPEAFFDASGEAGAGAWVVTRDRAPFLREPLERLSTRLGHGPSGPVRTVYDAAAVLRAALDIAPRPSGGAPARAEVVRALDQVIGVGTGGPLALVAGHPSPIQCTAYRSEGGARTATAAVQLNADGSVSRLDLTAGSAEPGSAQ